MSREENAKTLAEQLTRCREAAEAFDRASDREDAAKAERVKAMAKLDEEKRRYRVLVDKILGKANKVIGLVVLIVPSFMLMR